VVIGDEHPDRFGHGSILEELDIPSRLQRLLRAVGVALADGGGTEAVLQACCQALVDHLGAAFARIWTLEPGASVLRLRASAGMYTRLNGSFATVEVGSLKIGQIASERRAHLTNDVPHDPRVEDHEWAEAEGMVAFAGHPLVVEDRVVGVMALFARRPLTDEVLEELGSMAETIAQFLGRQLATEEERRRVGQELHDTVSQALYGISLAAQSGRRAAAANGAPAPVAEALDEVLDLTDRAQAELRAALLELRPDAIGSGGLVPALEQLAAAFTARHRVPVQLALEVEPELDQGAKLTLYRIAQEALANAGRHSSAHGVELRLNLLTGSGYQLEVGDDGPGFDVEAERPGHLGLATMRERAAARGWELAIESRPNSGTWVRVRVPS
jgi:signal transduction histidine kinase